MEITSLSNYACLNTTDFQSHRKSNAYISHLNYVQLYETLHLEMAAHFQKVTETGPSLKQVLLRSKFHIVGNHMSRLKSVLNMSTAPDRREWAAGNGTRDKCVCVCVCVCVGGGGPQVFFFQNAF